MSYFFANKIIWITGASSGIGEALAYEFSKQGAKLILSSRRESELNRVKKNCSGLPENILVLPMDLAVSPDIPAKALLAFEKWRGLDYLIHNAGIAARDLVEKTEMDVFRLVMETNYFGPVALTKAVLPFMLDAKKGHFVIVSSLSAKFGVPKLAAYAGSKHALHGFFESLRTEIRKEGIGISFIIPGFINTAILMKAIDGKGRVSGKNLAVNEKGMSVEQCAIKMVRAIQKGRQEALIGGSEKLSVYLHRFFPGLFNLIIASHPLKKLRRGLPGIIK
jgi:dehydrogenase/reductase SDR family protein 7B